LTSPDIFDVFDPQTRIGVCVRLVHGWRFQFTRRIGDYFLVIQALDRPEVRALEIEPTKEQLAKWGIQSPDDFDTLPVAKKWEILKPAANADVAIEVMKSARILD